MQSALLAAAILMTPVCAQEKVDLVRTYKLGEKVAYEFTSKVMIDFRVVPLETFIPQNDGFTYSFVMQTEAQKPDGVADIRFKRPKIVLNAGETFDSPPKDVVLLRNENYLFTLSNRNEILSLKDESPKRPEKKPKEEPPFFARAARPIQLEFPWMSEMRQLAAFVNFFDLGPILPSRPVAVGDTWKETVGYAPKTISSGADKGKSIIARIDYVYTFKGQADTDGRPAWHIQGKIAQDTDAAPFIAELLEVELSRAPFKEIRLKMDGTVDYYLARDSLQVLTIRASSEGSVSVTVPGGESGPVYEEKFRSRATMMRK